jgi:ribosomal peptide maturation radical SAM protein 1
MHDEKKSVLLVAMPFAGITIPSIQLPVLEGYCRERGIKIETRHLYLKAAEFYGLQNYHALIYPPNDSYTAQMVFSKYVFPEYWKNNEDGFREFFNQHSVQNSHLQQFSFDEYVHRTNRLYHWILDHVDWQSFDLIGFTLNYGQLLPSLAVAKKIKELTPDKKIVFGGSRTVDTLGMNVLRAFKYIDFIVSGDGEDALFRLASDYVNYKSIPRLMYKMEDQVIWNKSDVVVDLNSVPIPSYDQFYHELASTAVDVQQFYQYYGRLPVEISRGCWWNRCTFCNLNIQHQCYREKSVDRIIQEIQSLSKRYHMMDFQLIGNTLPKTEYRTLFEKLKQLRGDFSFFAEARAGQLTSDDYTVMKEAGFTMIQTGIESFSQNYLRKMNKGVRVIDNIAVLKFCKENGIKNTYNLLVRYPNEETVDFNETKQIVQMLKGYLDAPQLCELRVMHGSLIQRHPKQFNIEELDSTPIDRIMYPLEFLEKGFSFVYDFNRKIQSRENPWESLVEEWKKEREKFELEGITHQTTIDRLIFYFVDGGSFIKIYDKRDRQNIRIVVLNELERAVFLACVDVVSLEQLQQRFTTVPEFELIAMLQSFEKNGLMFVDNEHYLCLPLRFSVSEHPVIRTETSCEHLEHLL